MPRRSFLLARDLVAAGVVCALALVEAAQVYVGLTLLDAEVTWGHAVRATAPSWVVFLGLVIPLLRILDVSRGGPLTPLRLLAFAGGAVAFTGLHLAGSALLWEWIGPVSVGFPARFYRLATFYFVPGVLAYMAVVTLHAVVRRYREDKAREVEAAARRADDAQARFHALRGQLRPDFFFNTLNAVAGLMARGDAERGLEALTSLGRLLRASLTADPAGLVRLSDEVELVGEYLGIQEVRFPDRLDARCDVDDEAGRCAVPPLLLVQLVEALVDGGIGSGGRFTLRVMGRTDEGGVEVKVVHTGPRPADEILEPMRRRVGRFDGFGALASEAGTVTVTLRARPVEGRGLQPAEVA